MTTGIKSKGVDLDSIFAPYVQGTSPAATGVKFAGTDIHTRYAPLIYGTAAPATGITCKPGGAGSLVDLNTLFAAIGTPSYSLPFNGQTYSSAYAIPSGSSGYALIGFEILGGNTWQIYKSLNGAANVTLASGYIPAGSSTVKFTWGSYTIDPGFKDAGGGVTNGAVTPTLVSSNPLTFYQTSTATSTSGSRERKYPFVVDFYDASSNNISHSACTLIGATEGSI